MGLLWAASALEELVPLEIFARIQSTQVDPYNPVKDVETLRFINGQTGDIMGRIEVQKFYRLRRDKFRAILMEGLDIRFGKSIVDVKYSEDGSVITACFQDGSEDTGSVLIGTDGPHSTVRTLLVGPEKALVIPINFASTMCFSKHPRDKALFLRSEPHHPLFQCAPHPYGCFAWLGLHDAPDPEDPESWTFFHYNSFPEPRDSTNNRSAAEHVAHQKELAKQFADPFKSVFEGMPDDSTTAWYGKLRHWDPSLPEHKWNNQRGRITIAGDAAHPMTFQRGQGLNHAITDSLKLCNTIQRFWNSGTFSTDRRAMAIREYEDEMSQRSGEEVRLGEMNSKMMHDWDQVLESPVFKKGMGQLV